MVSALLCDDASDASSTASTPSPRQADNAATAAPLVSLPSVDGRGSLSYDGEEAWQQPVGSIAAAAIADALSLLSAARLPAIRRMVTACLLADPITVKSSGSSGEADGFVAGVVALCRASSGSDGTALPSPVEWAFDPREGSGPDQVELTNERRTAHSRTGSSSMAVLSRGFGGGAGPHAGRVVWEFRLVKDALNGECTCFGAVTKPITDRNFNYSSPHAWMYRAYNGALYGSGEWECGGCFNGRGCVVALSQITTIFLYLCLNVVSRRRCGRHQAKSARR